MGRRRHAHAHALRRAQGLQVGADLGEPQRRRRLQGVGLRRQGRRRVLDLQVGGRNAPRPARTDHGVAGANPHVHGDGGGDARSRGGRGGHRPRGPEDRRLPVHRPRRPERQHDRLGRAHHAHAHGHRRRHAGRALAAQEPRQGHASVARTPLRARAPSGSRPRSRPRAAPRSAAASGRRRSAPTTSPRTGSPTTASS